MATLVSPGVSISVTDESFYAPAGTGTVPLLIIATAQDKTSPDGTSTAAYTTAANAGKAFLVTSQRELLQNYGNPSFQSASGTQLHGDERNEYGLMAAYSFLGLSSRAYVLRADIDLSQLEASSTSPSGAPADGSHWLDIDTTVWGLKQYNGTSGKWESISASVVVASASDLQSGGTPKAAFGKDGDICVRYVNADGSVASVISLYEKASNAWYLIGSSAWTSATSKDFQYASHTTIPTQRSNTNALQDGDLYLQTTAPNNGTVFDMSKYSATSSQWVADSIVMRRYSSSAQAVYEADSNLVEGVLWADHDGENGEAEIAIKAWNGATNLTVQSTLAVSDTAISNSYIDASNVAFSIRVRNESVDPINVYLTSETSGNIAIDDVVADIQSALSSANVTTTFADKVSVSNVDGKVTFVNSEATDLILRDGNSGFGLAQLQLSDAVYSNWEAVTYSAQSTAPEGDVADGSLWYDADISADNIDLLEHNGTAWVTFTGDLQTKATEPTTQSDGSSSLNDGDVWINSADTENVRMFKYNGTDSAWAEIDMTDQSSPDGILFADIRASSTANQVYSNGVSPELYPTGMLLWNTQASGGNVKRYNGTDSKWESYSGNDVNGKAYLLRKAQRRAVVRAMQAAIVANDDIRSEVNRFNLVAAPGYAELTDEMIALITDRKDTAFALIDPPFRLAADATSVQNWATNANNASENGEDGLVSSSSEAAVYYPHGLTTNLDGTNVLVPASHMALRTYAFNDQVAFPWFAPAGFQRGLVDNATSVGYLDATEGEFVPVSLNEGQRDTYYINKVNPVATFPGRGISIFGQKTLNPTSSALDRVNVSRLVIYIREVLDDAVKPFLFEPNDSITRASAKLVVDRFLAELVAQRGLYDFVTVCDESNNTPARIDRNELHIDVAIQPVKAVEFIYIPIRIQNTLGSAG